MKKIFLFAAGIALALSSGAQTRLALYEEFTGENCGPCADTNPDFDLLTQATANKSKIQVIKYQVPIPSAGTILYPQAKVYADARTTYYTIKSAPNGKIDGATSSPTSASPGHPGYFTQAEIDAAAAVATPFEMSVTASWDPSFANINATITVKAVSAYSGMGAVFLRTALIESLEYCNAPGNNGETEFTNVVRSMFPDATGTSVAATWAAGTTQTYNFTIPVPAYVNRSGAPYIAVWIQSDGDKKIAQSAMSAALPKMAIDLAQSCPPDPDLTCITTANKSVTHNVTLKNVGTTSVSTADIYYKVNSGAYTKFTWAGSLAAGASTIVTMPAVTLDGGAVYEIRDSISLAADKNLANNAESQFIILLTSDPKTLPLTYGFESATPGYLNLGGWTRFGTGAHSGSVAAAVTLFRYAAGGNAIYTLPTPKIAGKARLEFWEAYKQVTADDKDKIEVVYSKDCGDTWTSMWSMTGSTHATGAPDNVNVYYPKAASEYVKRSVDISALPAGSLLAIRVVTDGGNMIWIDDINMESATAITEATQNVNNIVIAPNPASASTTLQFSLNQKSNVNVVVLDAVGKTVVSVLNEELAAGQQQATINTQELASGVYMVKITAGDKIMTERLSVVK